LITATTPNEADTRDMHPQLQNALHYARLKEQILSEPKILRCDVLDAAGHVTEVACSYAQYRDSVLDWAQQVRAAGLKLGEEAQSARPLIASDLRFSLRNLLLEVRELRTLFRCRFIWRRWEQLDFRLCNEAVPGMLMGSAAWLILALSTLTLLIVHYKIWRHLLDNRIVGEELEKYSKKYGYLQVTNN